MISLTIVLIILFIHWIADFVFQTDKMAQGKSKNWSDLLNHTFLYSMLFFLPMVIIFTYHLGEIDKATVLADYFICITFICHTITDYFTSRLNSKLWEQKKVHNFFVSIGLDQFLHFTQLLLTYYLLL